MRVPFLIAIVVCGAWSATVPAAPPAWERVGVRDGAALRTVDGAVIVEAADGGILVERADQCYELLRPDVIVSRTPLPPPPAESPRELGLRIAAGLPAGFDVHVTRHYVICFNTSRDYARWAGALFERIHGVFITAWGRSGIDLVVPDRPLIVVIFADRRDYEECVSREVGAMGDLVSGYYSFLTNRVTTYDLTSSAGRPQAPGRGAGRLGTEILARPEAEGLVSTLVHEATHQMAFNSGMHRRLAPVPLWWAEGVATYFETPDLRNQTGWRGLGSINRSRLRRFRQSYETGDIERIVGEDGAFRDADAAAGSYATAWALTWFLLETRQENVVKYLKMLGAKRPFTQYDRAERLADFTAFFGPPADLEPAFLRHMDRVERRAP